MRKIKQILPGYAALILFLLVSFATGSPWVVLAQPSISQSAGPITQAATAVPMPYRQYMVLIYSPPPEPRISAPTLLGPFGGSAVTITADPNHANIFYAGSAGSGVFKSTDYGSTWVGINNGLGNLTLDSFAVDPQDSNTLYAGTHGSGVYKSTDGGQSWRAVNQGIHSTAVVYTLAVDRGQHNVLFAGTRDPGVPDGAGTLYMGYLYKSVDGGSSWYPVYVTTNDWVYSVAVDPNRPNMVIAAVHVSGPIISSNTGESWSPASISEGEWYKGRAVAFDPRGATQRAYFSAWHGDFYWSVNSGASWNQSNSGLGSAHVFPNGIAVKPTSPDTVYMAIHNSGPAGIMKSTNAGSDWSPAGLEGRTVYTVAASAGANNNLVAGTYMDGIYRSTDGGASWDHANAGLTNMQVTGVAVPRQSVILASTITNGVQISTNNGASWTDFNNNLGGTAVNKLIADPGNPNVVFALTSGAGLRRVDLSVSSQWNPILNGAAELTAVPSAPEFTAPQIRREPLDDFLELEGEALPAAPSEKTAAAASNMLDMAFAPSNPAYVYLGSAGGGLFRSTNSGISWEQVGLPGETVRSVAVNPVNPNQVWVVTDNVKYSTDGGHTWTGTPISGPQINVIAFSNDPDHHLFAGTSQGLWEYFGPNWQQVNLPDASIISLAVLPTQQDWFIAGTASGAYVLGPGQFMQKMFAEIYGSQVQSITFDRSVPSQVYLSTTYRGVVRYQITR